MAAAVAKPTKRAQVPKACQRCKRLQKGCSAYRPCQRCVRAGLGELCVADAALVGPAGPVGPAAAWSVTRLPMSPGQHMQQHASPLASFARQAELLSAAVVDHCRRRFFAELYPTIPIVSEAFVDGLCHRSVGAQAAVDEDNVVNDDDDDAAGAAHCLLAALCAMVLLQVEVPEGHAVDAVQDNGTYGRRLFGEAAAAYHHQSQRLVPSLERVLAAFFLYAGHAVQFHHSRAFFFLREASSLFLLLRRDQEPDAARLRLADRLFWVLLVSERSHAIRYQRPATLQITPASPGADAYTELPGLARLVALFRPLDTAFVALLNQELQGSLSLGAAAAALDRIEGAIDSALAPPLDDLCDTQRANLQTTQLWLQIILWQLRLRLGLLSAQHVDRPSRTYRYPLDVAGRLAAAARCIPFASLRVHGAGLTEKFFDVACTIVDVLARVPSADSVNANDTNNGDENGTAQRPEDDLRYLRQLVAQLPGGKALYDALLYKHILQTLPEAG